MPHKLQFSFWSPALWTTASFAMWRIHDMFCILKSIYVAANLFCTWFNYPDFTSIVILQQWKPDTILHNYDKKTGYKAKFANYISNSYCQTKFLVCCIVRATRGLVRACGQTRMFPVSSHCRAYHMWTSPLLCGDIRRVLTPNNKIQMASNLHFYFAWLRTRGSLKTPA